MIVKPDYRSTGWHLTALLMIVVWSALGCSAEAPPAAGSPRGAQALIPVSAYEVRPQTLHRTLSVSASIEPRHRVRVGSRISGLVETVHVSEGHQVAAGEILATLDISELRAELVRARAEEASARLAFDRAKALQTRGVQSVAQLDAARIALEVAESEHALLRTRLSFGSIVSPVDAVVSARMLEPGESVQAHVPLFELVSQRELVLRAGVSELDVVHVEQGDIVPLVIDALPSLTLEGTVSRIFPVANPMTRLTTVEIALPQDAAERGVRSGFLARVRAPIDVRSEVLAVPVASLGQDSSGYFVFEIDDGILRRIDVTPGASYAEWVEIHSGLTPGMLLLASNPVGVRPGLAVRVVSPRSSE